MSSYLVPTVASNLQEASWAVVGEVGVRARKHKSPVQHAVMYTVECEMIAIPGQSASLSSVSLKPVVMRYLV